MANLSIKHWLLGLSVVLAAGLLVPAGREVVLAQPSSAATLHREAIIVDGHEHITNRVYWEGIDPWKVQTTGLADYARAKQGGLDVIVEQVYLEDPVMNYNYAVKQAVRLVETFHRVLEASRDKMELALSTADVRRIVGTGKMAVILALEGGFDTEGDLDVLRLFYRLGVRMVQFSSHNTTNAFVDAGLGEQKWGGITEHGRTVIREMNRLGILISISHASNAAQLQIIEASAAPVVADHQGLRKFSDAPRTLSDEVLQALAAKGGLVGMHSSAGFLSQKYQEWSRGRPAQQGAQRPALPLLQSPTQDYGKYVAALDTRLRDNWKRNYSRPWRELQRELIDAGAPLPTVEEDWMNHVDHAVKLVGDDHVGIGLDMEAGGRYLRDFDATSYPRLTEAMVARGYSPARVRKILGENWLRMFDTEPGRLPERPAAQR
jgi:membrane dipeptidase